ncbi:Uracil DNA glycosylase superfamily protein [Calycomorphotria hydatis]|uniref:Type-5 uracil-DNA glycosylase n=2 Tax=Calycomorphotria hydatis TaxID=2528027 RepID=A0A517T4F1_9PLAN|nr:Uracil DNA glycosylase superfamily protein [Calycomorphotria hydatis]
MAFKDLNDRIIRCDRCPRLIEYCADVAEKKRRAYAEETYWGRPVPNFGDPHGKILIVGLAPGAHGANRTGRMFTGDRSGDFLYAALHRAGFASQPTSTDADDGLKLLNCSITAACHCAPPGNKPTREEITNCAGWLEETIALLQPKVFLALGGLAWNAIFDHAKQSELHTGPRPKFAHAATHTLPNQITVLGCYHPSQQNTFTGRLTEEMMDEVLEAAKTF